MNKNAFTLAEIIVTTIIVGILVMIAIPNLSRMTSKHNEIDVYQNLRMIHAAQQEYSLNNGATITTPNFYLSGTMNDLNTNLKLNILPLAGETYSCANDASLGQICNAVFPGGLEMVVGLDDPVRTPANNPSPRYCQESGGGPALDDVNPCCRIGASGKDPLDPCP